MSKDLVVAIDGPSGSGKSTIAKELAKHMDFLYVDTGAMYRALGYYFHKNSVPFEDGDDAKKALESVSFIYGKDKGTLVEVNGENVTDTIREHYVSDLASRVSKLTMIRDFLLDTQRNLAKDKVCVMEGRDIGTVIFPGAFCKIFLTASAEVRAQRRLDQLKELGETDVTLEQIIDDVKARDERDSNRAVAPLKQAEDAILLDSSDMNLQEVLEKISECVQSRAQESKIDL